MCIKHIEPHRTHRERERKRDGTRACGRASFTFRLLTVNFLYFYIFNHHPSFPFYLCTAFVFGFFFPFCHAVCVYKSISSGKSEHSMAIFARTYTERESEEREEVKGDLNTLKSGGGRAAHISKPNEWKKILRRYSIYNVCIYISWKSSVCTIHMYRVYAWRTYACVCVYCLVSIVMLEIHFCRLVRCCHWWLMWILLLLLLFLLPYFNSDDYHRY